MARRSGRPRANLEQKFLGMSEHHKDIEALLTGAAAWTPDEGITWVTLPDAPRIMAFEAACLLLAIERGTDPRSILFRPIFQKIKQYACNNGPHGKWRTARDFLEQFINMYPLGFDWREDSRQGEKEDRIRKQEDDLIAQERAEDARLGMSQATKYYTPDAPDDYWLCALAWEYRKRRRLIRTTWPTLRELKLATAIPERTLKTIIKSLRPKKDEIVTLPFRHKFSRRGALPLRYGPRLIVGVLNAFIARLSEFPAEGVERKRLRETALLVKRAFPARLGRSPRST
jgi:hypothetical protein